MNIKKTDIRHGWSWVVSGLEMLKKDPGLWAGMGFVFMLIAIVLKLIPFIGLLLLVLLCPMLLAGALHAANNLDGGAVPAPAAKNSRPGQLPQRITAELQRAAGRLFMVFSDEEKILPLMVISTLTLGMVVVINILAVLLKIDGSALTAMAAGSVGPRIWVPALIGWFLVLLLQLALTMGVLYSVPLILFRHEMPLVAIEKSFTTCKQHIVALSVFSVPFLLVNMLISALFFALPFPLDYLAVFTLGWIAAPLFAAGLHRSYQDIFVR